MRYRHARPIGDQRLGRGGHVEHLDGMLLLRWLRLDGQREGIEFGGGGQCVLRQTCQICSMSSLAHDEYSDNDGDQSHCADSCSGPNGCSARAMGGWHSGDGRNCNNRGHVGGCQNVRSAHLLAPGSYSIQSLRYGRA
ncbi:unnamed protein product [Mycena citricolor]|uniref:Uncharacterized protein n=1 Tax=Mycena citricolor TaxID=2018698 RepID=A0AAD2HIM2_9AGAR|nr:unnamed protein product [Mycena citricolor]